jgi:hypothetical protein
MLNEKDGKIRGFDAGLAQMLTATSWAMRPSTNSRR